MLLPISAQARPAARLSLSRRCSSTRRLLISPHGPCVRGSVCESGDTVTLHACSPHLTPPVPASRGVATSAILTVYRVRTTTTVHEFLLAWHGSMSIYARRHACRWALNVGDPAGSAGRGQRMAGKHLLLSCPQLLKPTPWQ
jgi:hypothetical protein